MDLDNFFDISTVIFTSLLLLLITVCYLIFIPNVNIPRKYEESTQNKDQKRKLSSIQNKKQKKSSTSIMIKDAMTQTEADDGSKLKLKYSSLSSSFENLQEKYKSLTEEFEILNDELLQQRIMFDTKKRKIIELERTIEEQQIQILRFDNCEEERKKLEKLIQEQQKIIKLALERIVPRKSEENQKLQFCMEHMKTIREFEGKYL